MQSNVFGVCRMGKFLWWVLVYVNLKQKSKEVFGGIFNNLIGIHKKIHGPASDNPLSPPTWYYHVFHTSSPFINNNQFSIMFTIEKI